MLYAITQTALSQEMEESFDLAGKAKADGLEIIIANENQSRLLGDNNLIKQIKTLANRHKLAVPSVNLSNLRERPSLIGTQQVIQASQEVIERGIQTASAVGAGVLVIPFFGKNLIETEDELNRAAKTLAELTEQAEQSQVTLGIESTLNCNQMTFMLDFLGHSPNVKIYYNTGNALARKFDPATLIRDLGRDSICQVHLKDVRIGESLPPNFDVPLGQGSVDFRTVAHALRAIGYDGWLALETPPGDSPLDTAKQNLNFAREIMSSPSMDD